MVQQLQPLAEEYKKHMSSRAEKKNNPLGHLRRVDDSDVPSVLQRMHEANMARE